MRFSFIIILIVSINFFSRAQPNHRPKLIVGIVVDQMCYEYLYRYYDKFSKSGFRKLMDKGSNCRNTRYNYVPTFTGPGHASIYTGTTPSNHGIVANDWFDRNTGKLINCVDDESVHSVGSNSSEGLCSPQHLKTLTITDQVKLTYPSSKVISMSIKDRGAILPGGHLSDGSYWYDYTNGNFITSSYFQDKLPKWVEQFNQRKVVDRYMSQTWNTFFDISTYRESGPDASPYEQLLPGKAQPVFPYNMDSISKLGNKYQLFTITPFANTALTDLAIESLSNEQLGKDEQTDMLCISYSTPDIAGHAFGPQSVELEDIYIRLDLELARLITSLEKSVGKGEFTIFLTADHAVVPVPQLLSDMKLPGGYVFLDEQFSMLSGEIKKRFGADLIQSYENLNVYLNVQRIDSLGIQKNDVLNFCKEKISEFPNVKQVFTAEMLLNYKGLNEWGEMVGRGYHPSESGDLIFILEPGFLPKHAENETSRKGTSHGSGFNYDTHVPLLWYGKGIKKKEIVRKTDITDIAATLVNILYLQRSGAMTGEPLIELFQK